MITTRDRVLAEVARRIAAVQRPHPVRVAIDGVDAAGKTTMADELAGAIEQLNRPVIRASIDGFHNPRAIRYQQGSMSPEGYFADSFNYLALIEYLLRPLGPDGLKSFCRAAYDVRADTPVAPRFETAPPDAVLILDGVFLLRDELREHFDFSIFVRADFAVTTARAEARDRDVFGGVEEARRRYRQRYVPGQQLYLSAADPEQRASMVVDNNDLMAPKILR